jgi:hypothetical protein
MAATGFTPIQPYYSITATNVPLAGDMVTAELALNAVDGKLYFKNSSGVVTLLANTATVAPVTSFSGGTTGLTPSTATSGAITLGGTLAVTNGGTGQTSFAANQIQYGSFSQSANLTFNGTVLAVTGALTATADSTFSSTGALLVSKGTTAQQPGSPVTGMIRYNTSTFQFEGYAGSSPSWLPVGGSVISNDTATTTNLYPIFVTATSGTATTVYTSNAKYLYKPSTGELQAPEVIASNGLVLNATTLVSSYTIPTGFNASTVGPFTVPSGLSVTVSSGQRWVIL